jgi:oxygen-dependent protoporphyrinogen oxidase
MAEIDTQLLVLDKADVGVDPWPGFISVDGAFLSAVSRDFLDDPRLRGFAFHFPGDLLDETARIDAACGRWTPSPEQVRATPASATACRPCARGIWSVVARWTGRWPAALGVTGNWFLGVSIEDCVTRSRSEHERRFGPLPADAA